MASYWFGLCQTFGSLIKKRCNLKGNDIYEGQLRASTPSAVTFKWHSNTIVSTPPERSYKRSQDNLSLKVKDVLIGQIEMLTSFTASLFSSLAHILLLRLSVPSGLYSTALASLLKYPQTQRSSSWLTLQTSSPTILAFLKPLTFPSPAESKPACLDALFLRPPSNYFITLFICFIFSLLSTYAKMNSAAFPQGLKSSTAKQGTLKNKSLTHRYWDDDLTSRPSLKAHQNPTWSHV